MRPPEINADNGKELRISFAKEQRVFDPIIIEGKEVELVTSTKLQGLTIASDLSWNDHVTEITKKASKSLYFLTQLKRAGVPKQYLALFYVSCVRSVIDYAAPVFFKGLPPVLKERAGTGREKSNINNNLRKVQLGNRGGVNTHFGALLRIV